MTKLEKKEEGRGRQIPAVPNPHAPPPNEGAELLTANGSEAAFHKLMHMSKGGFRSVGGALADALGSYAPRPGPRLALAAGNMTLTPLIIAPNTLRSICSNGPLGCQQA